MARCGDRTDRTWRASLCDVIAPSLENLGTALQQVGSLIRLNDLTPGHMGEAGLRDLRRDAGLGHPRPRARTEPVNRRGDPGSPKHAPRRVHGQLPADLTKYDVKIAGEHYPAQSKRWTMFHLVSGVLANGGTPEQVMEAISWRRGSLFKVFEGHLSADQVYEQIMEADTGGRVLRAKRYFCHEGEIFHHVDNKTYVLTNQWGRRTPEAADSLAKTFSQLAIEIKPSK